jgi:RNA polymerase sigma-70 factor (family 1)
MFEQVPCEKELLFKVAHGDEHAFNELFHAYHQHLGTHIFRITDSMELAEEVVQDMFLKVWINRKTLTTVENFKGYLFVLSKNHALNCLRKLAKERALQNSIDNNDQPVLEIADQDGGDNYYTLLDEAIDHLPPQQQKVYLLSRHSRLKYDEIARQMGLSRETVKKYLQASTLSITNFVQSHTDVLTLALAFLIFF